MPGNRRHIPEDIKQHIVVLASRGYTHSVVADIMEVSPRTVRRVLRLAEQTGSVARRPSTVSRPRSLNDVHVAYLEGCLERKPDMYPSELQHQLFGVHGIEASEATILRTLIRRGWTRKQVVIANAIN